VSAHKGMGGAGLNVQFGCGWCAPEGWRNFDASPTLRFERVPLVGRLWSKNASRFPDNVECGDIVKGLPVADESCANVYSSHVLEHLCLADFRTALRNTYSLLRPGGVFRFVLPDLRYHIERYVAGDTSEAASTFMRETALGCETRVRGLRGLMVTWLGNSSHLWMWDYQAVELELRRVGFVEIRRASFNDSLEPSFRKVETEGRWRDCLGVECKRPG
jgi:SAM-dependent methyltransferase